MGNETAEVVIVGAGIQGASLAFHLVERGLRPLIVEAGTVGCGATGRSSGMVRMHYDVEADARLAWRSWAYFADWANRVGGDAGFEPVGFLQMVAPGDRAALEANVAMQQRVGIPTSVVEADAVRRLLPGVEIGDDQLAAFEPQSGFADPAAACGSLLRAAVAGGARLLQHRPVTAIRVARDSVVGVATAAGDVDAPLVVNAAGAWAGRLAATAGLIVPLEVWRHDVAYVRRPPGVGRHAGFIDFANLFYSRPEGDSLTLVALEDNSGFGGDPDASVDAAASGFIERAAERIVRRLPAFAAAGLHSAHSGQDGITPDQHPLIGPAGPDGLWLSCGYSGTGFKTAPAIGASLADWIVDGADADGALALYAPDRFDRGAPVVGEHSYGNMWH